LFDAYTNERFIYCVSCPSSTISISEEDGHYDGVSNFLVGRKLSSDVSKLTYVFDLRCPGEVERLIRSELGVRAIEAFISQKRSLAKAVIEQLGESLTRRIIELLKLNTTEAILLASRTPGSIALPLIRVPD